MVVELVEVLLEELAGGVKEPVHLMGVGPTGEPIMRCDEPELDRAEQLELHLISTGQKLAKSKFRRETLFLQLLI